MPVMSRVDEVLDHNFEIILVVEGPRINFSLDAIEASQNIHSALLVTRWGIFEVCQCTLKFQSIFVILEKLCSDGLVEGNARKAIVHRQSSKETV